jgi:hypothetical protein
MRTFFGSEAGDCRAYAYPRELRAPASRGVRVPLSIAKVQPLRGTRTLASWVDAVPEGYTYPLEAERTALEGYAYPLDAAKTRPWGVSEPPRAASGRLSKGMRTLSKAGHPIAGGYAYPSSPRREQHGEVGEAFIVRQ